MSFPTPLVTISLEEYNELIDIKRKADNPPTGWEKALSEILEICYKHGTQCSMAYNLTSQVSDCLKKNNMTIVKNVNDGFFKIVAIDTTPPSD